MKKFAFAIALTLASTSLYAGSAKMDPTMNDNMVVKNEAASSQGNNTLLIILLVAVAAFALKKK